MSVEELCDAAKDGHVEGALSVAGHGEVLIRHHGCERVM